MLLGELGGIALVPLGVLGIVLLADDYPEHLLRGLVDRDDDVVDLAVEGDVLALAVGHLPSAMLLDDEAFLLLVGLVLAVLAGLAVDLGERVAQLGLVLPVSAARFADLLDVDEDAGLLELLEVEQAHVMDERDARHVPHRRVLRPAPVVDHEVLNRDPVAAHAPLEGVPVRAAERRAVGAELRERVVHARAHLGHPVSDVVVAVLLGRVGALEVGGAARRRVEHLAALGPDHVEEARLHLQHRVRQDRQRDVRRLLEGERLHLLQADVKLGELLELLHPRRARLHVGREVVHAPAGHVGELALFEERGDVRRFARPLGSRCSTRDAPLVGFNRDELGLARLFGDFHRYPLLTQTCPPVRRLSRTSSCGIRVPPVRPQQRHWIGR